MFEGSAGRGECGTEFKSGAILCSCVLVLLCSCALVFLCFCVLAEHLSLSSLEVADVSEDQ
jgi:hypothetical protein